MEFEFKVRVVVERESGKFAARDEIQSELQSTLESADPGSVDGVGADGDSTYNVIEFEVMEGGE